MIGGRGKGVRTEWSDAEMLVALDLLDRQHLSCAAVALALNARFRTGRDKNSILGIKFRADAEARKVVDLCRKAENRDGGMPPEWWQAGLRRRAERVFEPVAPQTPTVAKVAKVAKAVRTYKSRVFVWQPPAAPAPAPPPAAKPRLAVPPTTRPSLVAGVAHGGWLPSTDLAILRGATLGRTFAVLAADLARPLPHVLARWHRLRVVRGLDAALTRYLENHGDSYDPALQGAIDIKIARYN